MLFYMNRNLVALWYQEPIRQTNVATLVNNLGRVLQALGDLAGARAAFERALTIFQEILGEDHPNTMLVRNPLDLLTLR